MSEPVTLEQFRSLLAETVTPITDRLATLEQRTNPANLTPAAPIATLPADERAAKAEARAAAAEGALSDVLAAPHRVGRQVHLSLPDGMPSSQGTDLVERSRKDSPALATVATRAIAVLEGTGPNRPSKATLHRTLRSLFMAAEQDGLITDPTLKSNW